MIKVIKKSQNLNIYYKNNGLKRKVIIQVSISIAVDRKSLNLIMEILVKPYFMQAIDYIGK